MTASTVRAEEEAFFSLLARSPRLVAKHVPNPNALTGERLQWLQSTHGIEPDTVEAVLGIQIPSAVIETYLMAMDAHREASRAS